MIVVRWDSYEFKVLQHGLDIFTTNMKGHRHSANSYELHCIVGGEGTLKTEDAEYKLEDGVFFMTGPNFYHQQSTNPQNPVQEIFVYLQGFGKKTNKPLLSRFLDTTFYIGTPTHLKPSFERILQEKNEKKPGWENATEGILLQLLVDISRLYSHENVENADESGSENITLNDKRFLLIEQAFIERDKDLTLAELAQRIGLCERQTQRLLKKYYGKTFKELRQQS